MKLKDIKFHNLKASISEIILMIEYFGDLDCDQDIIDPINSDYCARFILNVNYYNDFSKEFKIKYIAWLCARFPNLKEIELDGISNTINQTILENIMFNTEEKYSKYLSQINKIIWKQYKNNLDQESYIFISKSNIKLGVCINGKMTICKVNRFMINCKFDNVQIFESDFNQNQQYLLFNDDEIQFEIEGIQTDTHCGETEHLSYYKIMTGFISKKSNDCSLLFILQIEKITIPKNINDIPILLNIYINDDYKPTYKITWSQDKINKEFESFIDSLDNHSKVAINVVDKIKSNNCLYSKIRLIENNSCKIKNNTQDYLSSLCNLWSKLFSKNIVSLQVQDVMKSKPIFDLLINFLSSLNQIYKSRLNCLELKLENNQEVDIVLEAIKCNYAIKTIKLDTPNRVNFATEDKAEKILSQRIATKICLNSKVKQFKFYLQKNFELSYPTLWK